MSFMCVTPACSTAVTRFLFMCSYILTSSELVQTHRVRWRLKTFSGHSASRRTFLCLPAEGAMAKRLLLLRLKQPSGTEASLEKQVIGFFKLKETSDWMTMGLCSIIDFQTSELKHSQKCLAHTVYVTPISADSSVRKCSFWISAPVTRR